MSTTNKRSDWGWFTTNRVFFSLGILYIIIGVANNSAFLGVGIVFFILGCMPEDVWGTSKFENKEGPARTEDGKLDLTKY